MSNDPIKVQVLPDDLISKIAAGEVVQRPASVVKELVENSIDAGAKKVKIIIRNSGKSLIRIVDDGHGMSEDNLLLAVERHATSKIKSYNDLEGVSTLGFRGEALPSISSISRFEVRAAVLGAIEGTSIRIEGGRIKSVEPIEAIPGTSVNVANLFFNTPARRKFLKSGKVEYRHILQSVKRFALAYPEVTFEFYNEDKLIFAAREGDLANRIGETFSSSYLDKIKPVSATERGVKVDGFVGDMNLVRRSRGEQYMFMNRRFILDKKMSSAVFSAYGDLVGRGEFPFFVINLGIDPHSVDVNVHPAKMEVKFRNEWEVYETIKNAVRQTIHPSRGMADNYVPTAVQRGFTPQPVPMHGKVIPFLPDKHSHPPIESSIGRPVRAEEVAEKDEGFVPAKEAYEAVFPGDSGISDHVEGHVWQIHNKYLISQVKSGIVVIDQHVAHERILYEQALRSIEKGGGTSQQLLFPQTIELSPEDHSVLFEILAFLNNIGFEISEFGARTIILQAVPADIKAGTEGKVLGEILDNYRRTSSKEVPAHKALAASFACKAAIKAGEKLNPQETRSLVDRLFLTEYPYFCPHGRPVLINLTLDDLDKRFERK